MTTRVLMAMAVFLWGSTARAQPPEERGSMSVAEWDAGPLPAAGAMIRTRVFYPETAPGPVPLVGVIHGASANGSYHAELAGTLASRGFVAVVPDMPCTVTSCDHDANQLQITALLEWAVAQGGDPSSRLSGRVDGSRRGLIGHSWGGLSSHLTAARDPNIDSLVLFDPNDDGGVGLAATPTVGVPVLQLLAEVPGLCNSAWDEAGVRGALAGTNLQLTVSGSGHCDAGEVDVVCSFACGAGDRSTTSLFRRYAVAWTACVLSADPAMAPWLGGSEMGGDVSGGRIEGVLDRGLDALPCRGAPGVDAGTVDRDGGLLDADSGAPGTDSGSPPSPEDAAPPLGVDAGPVASSDAGCGCTVDPRDAAPKGMALAILLVLGLRRRRFARTSHQRGGSRPS